MCTFGDLSPMEPMIETADPPACSGALQLS